MKKSPPSRRHTRTIPPKFWKHRNRHYLCWNLCTSSMLVNLTIIKCLTCVLWCWRRCRLIGFVGTDRSDNFAHAIRIPYFLPCFLYSHLSFSAQLSRGSRWVHFIHPINRFPIGSPPTLYVLFIYWLQDSLKLTRDKALVTWNLVEIERGGEATKTFVNVC